MLVVIVLVGLVGAAVQAWRAHALYATLREPGIEDAQRRKVRRDVWQQVGLISINVFVAVACFVLAQLGKSDATEQREALEQQLAAEREARSEIEHRMAWRHVSDEQRQRLTQVVRAHGSAAITIGAIQDPEAIAFAVEISKAIDAAGGRVFPLPLGTIIPTPYGLQCQPGKLAADLSSALNVPCPTKVFTPPAAGATIVIGARLPQS